MCLHSVPFLMTWRQCCVTQLVLSCRGELSTQLSQLTAELRTLKTSFETMQDFVQLPLVFIWQQQLGHVIKQALAHELSSVPHSLHSESSQQTVLRQAPLQSPATLTHHAQAAPTGLPKQAPTMTHQLGPAQAFVPKQAALPEQAMQHDTKSHPDLEGSSISSPVHASASLQSTSAEELSDSAHQGYSGPAPGPSQTDAVPSQQPADTESAGAQEAAHDLDEHQPNQASLSASPLPMPLSSQQLPFRPAGQARLPVQATHRGLPKEAFPAAQPTFLRVCLAELLRLTDPAQSQFQPLLCGWYSSG